MQHLLHVQRQHQEHGEHARPEEETDDVRAAKVCNRKIEKGTKGSFTRFSQTRNATSSLRDDEHPIVSAELQPHARP